MNPKYNKILNGIVILTWIGLIFEGIYLYNSWPRQTEVFGQEKIKKEIIKEDVLPDFFELDIPFITQAPFRSWKEYPFNHTCEEASILMVHYYLENKTKVVESETKKELLDLVDFQIKNYGFHEDTSTAETARIIKDYYGYKVKIYYDISLEDIKKEIAQGNPVIIPTAGRLLENPNYTGAGPIYHMLVVKGYTSTEFITQDSGTYRSGENKTYSYEILEKAIHDWNGEEKDMNTNQSAMIVIIP